MAGIAIVGKMPDDPIERKKVSDSLFRLHVSMNYIGRKCAFCLIEYTSVDNFIEREPYKGNNEDIVDKICWNAYNKKEASQ